MADTRPPPSAHRARLEALGLPPAVGAAVAALLNPRVRGAPGAPAGAPALPQGWQWGDDGAGGSLLLQPREGRGPLPWLWADECGEVHLLARWQGTAPQDAALHGAAFRLPAGDWLELKPGAGTHPLWGVSDALLHAAAAVSSASPGPGRLCGLLPSQPYDALEWLPPFDRPAALPPGAGEAVLNFLALLLRLQGTASVNYRGPYPTAALFESLRRSFALAGDPETARQGFTRTDTALAFRGRMAVNPVPWRPAPFAPRRPRPGLVLHLRAGVETAWLHGVAFRRVEPIGGPAHRAPRPLPCGERLWPEGSGADAGLAAGLVLLGRPYCRFLRLDGHGAVRAFAPLEPLHAAAAIPLDPRWREVLRAWVTLRAHAGLAASVGAALDALALSWRPLPVRVAVLNDAGLALHSALAGEFRRRAPEEDAPALAMMLVSDVLEVATPHLLRAAQGVLADTPADAPLAAAWGLSGAGDGPGPLLAAGEAAQADARARLAQALPALVRALAAGEALPRTGAPGDQDLEDRDRGDQDAAS